MSARRLALALLVLLLILTFFPSAASPVRSAGASSSGSVSCSSPGPTTSDGTITAAEYPDDYFDAATDLLVYLRCDNSTERLLHVGIVSPWDGWVGILVQSSETWDGHVNEVRVAANETSGTLRVMDAYGNVTSGASSPDVPLGGTSDVRDAATGIQGAARVYEFVIALNSTDPYDSRLRSDGPFAFALAYSAFETDLQSPATAISGLHPFEIRAPAVAGTWTSLEFTAGLSPTSPGTVVFLATLRDGIGYPIPSVQIEVFLRTAFGMYDAGAVATNEQGVGQVTYALPDNGTYFVGVGYAGADGVLASVAWRAVLVSSPYDGSGVGLSLVDIGSLELRPVEALVVVIVAGVWAAYAYAFFVTWASMRRAPKASVHRAERPYYRNESFFGRREGK